MRLVPESFTPQSTVGNDFQSIRAAIAILTKTLSVFFNAIGYRVNRTFPKDGSEALEGLIELTQDGPVVLVGSGSPEGVETAVVGSTFHRTDGGAGSSFYVKESGTGNTGWAAK